MKRYTEAELEMLHNSPEACCNSDLRNNPQVMNYVPKSRRPGATSEPKRDSLCKMFDDIWEERNQSLSNTWEEKLKYYGI